MWKLSPGSTITRASGNRRAKRSTVSTDCNPLSVVVTISVGAVMRGKTVSRSMSIRAEDAPCAERCAVLPISSSAHHVICASDAVLPSRDRMVSAAHCRTPFVRIASAFPLPLPRIGEPNRLSDSSRCGCSLANCMHAEPPYLAPIRWQASMPSASRNRPISAASSPALKP